MTAQAIADRLVHDPGKGITPERLKKVDQLCARHKVNKADVLRLAVESSERRTAALRELA